MSTDLNLNVFIDVVLSEFKHIKNYHEWHIKAKLAEITPSKVELEQMVANSKGATELIKDEDSFEEVFHVVTSVEAAGLSRVRVDSMGTGDVAEAVDSSGGTELRKRM